jgi:hypothetical protein
MNVLSLPPRVFLVTTLALLSTGCGGGTRPKLGTVSGRVTLDGKPVDGAHIEFTPVIEGRPSAGTSDSTGSYVLSYKGSIKGARIGDHDVTVTTFREELTVVEPTGDEEPTANNGSEDSIKIIPGRAEEIPEKYATEKIRVTVEPGSNMINLELTSD